MDSSVEARLEDCRSQSALRDMGVATSGVASEATRETDSHWKQRPAKSGFLGQSLSQGLRRRSSYRNTP